MLSYPDYQVAKISKVLTTHFVGQAMSKEALTCNASLSAKWHNI